MEHNNNSGFSNQQGQAQADGQHQYYNQYPYYTPVSAHVKEWFNFREPSYVKGFVIGAGVALILTNPTVKKTLVKGVVKLWGGLQGGVEELKEQIRDVQAEMGGE